MSTLATTPNPIDTRADSAILRVLTGIDGLGSRALWRLLADAGSPAALWEAPEAFIRANLSAEKARAFLRARDESEARGGPGRDWLESDAGFGIQALPYTDPRYPALLKEIHSPPALLYVQGNPEALSGKTLAIVGTRNASEYGRQVVEALMRDLQPAGVTIISGLAAGIDTLAHAAAIHHGLPTVAVYGCGLDIIYPRSNKPLAEAIVETGGALVSEYPLGTPGSRFTYPQRNRIVAGLSHGVLIAEGDIRSGSMITARLASEEGRTVFAVPGNIFSPGSQGPFVLIQSGAVPVATGEDILQNLNWWQEGVSRQLGLDVSEAGRMIADATMNMASPATPQSLAAGLEKGGGSAFEANRAAGTEKMPGSPAHRLTGKPPLPPSALPPDLPEDEAALLKAIPVEPVGVDDLARAAALPAERVSTLLTLLELEGLVVLLPGSRVCRR